MLLIATSSTPLRLCRSSSSRLSFSLRATSTSLAVTAFAMGCSCTEAACCCSFDACLLVGEGLRLSLRSSVSNDIGGRVSMADCTTSLACRRWRRRCCSSCWALLRKLVARSRRGRCLCCFSTSVASGSVRDRCGARLSILISIIAMHRECLNIQVICRLMSKVKLGSLRGLSSRG